MPLQESKDQGNEIILVLKPHSGVSVKEGAFHSADKAQTELVNRQLKESEATVRKISIPAQEQSSGATEYYQILLSGDPTKLLENLKKQEWIESVYLKPKSEDPGGF